MQLSSASRPAIEQQNAITLCDGQTIGDQEFADHINRMLTGPVTNATTGPSTAALWLASHPASH